MQEKSMHQRFICREISNIEYRNWLAHKRGYNSFNEWRKDYKKGICKKKEDTMWHKYIIGNITLKEYKDWLAQKHGFNNSYEIDKKYRQTNHIKIVETRKQYNQNHKEQISEYKKKYYQDNKEIILEKNKKYYEIHKKQCAENSKQYNKLHKEHIAECKKQYRGEHKEQIVISRKIWFKEHYGNENEYRKQYYQTSNGKILIKKSINKRQRELGYSVLNPQDATNPEYVGHHLDKINVLFIPEKLHKSVFHSVLMNINMNKINDVAINWYIKQKVFSIK